MNSVMEMKPFSFAVLESRQVLRWLDSGNSHSVGNKFRYEHFLMK